MQRPIMDPLFLQEEADLCEPRSKLNWLTPIRLCLRGVGWIVGTLLSNPLPRRGHKREADYEGAWGWLIREATSRLVFVPLLLAVTVAVLVYSGTHPPLPPPGLGPTSVGLYYEAVDFTSDDATKLRGWLIPALDARRVLEGDDRSLCSRRPGIVLAHDYGQSPSQLLPLLAPLHDAGCELLVVGLRGVGLGRPAGQTFGPAESRDIAAAVQVLRGHPLVDPKRIGILGIGTGANAALLAAERDPGIAALVLADPVAGSREAIARYVGPNRWPMAWIRPCSRWGWEIGYRIGPEEINLARFEGLLTADQTFCADKAVEPDGGLSPAFVHGATEFCSMRLNG